MFFTCDTSHFEMSLLNDFEKTYTKVTLNMLSNKPRAPPCNLTRDEEGNLLNSPEDTVRRWRNFLQEKFKAIPEESQRPVLEELPKMVEKITWSEFEITIKHLKVGKATGPDGIPSKVFKYCPDIKNELFHFLSYLWDEEVVPQNLVTANFQMLFKNKGSCDDPSRYRCIALRNHAYKALSLILLGRMIGISDSFLQDWQTGFREARGCRDNSMILRVLCDKLISIGKSLAVVFVDYSAAFDSVCLAQTRRCHPQGGWCFTKSSCDVSCDI